MFTTHKGTLNNNTIPLNTMPFAPHITSHHIPTPSDSIPIIQHHSNSLTVTTSEKPKNKQAAVH